MLPDRPLLHNWQLFKQVQLVNDLTNAPNSLELRSSVLMPRYFKYSICFFVFDNFALFLFIYLLPFSTCSRILRNRIPCSSSRYGGRRSPLHSQWPKTLQTTKLASTDQPARFTGNKARTRPHEHSRAPSLICIPQAQNRLPSGREDNAGNGATRPTPNSLDK